MSGKTYTITEAKAQLSDIIRRVKQGEIITIGASGSPEVVLSIYSGVTKKREFGKLRGTVWISPDFCEPDSSIERLFSGEPA